MRGSDDAHDPKRNDGHCSPSVSITCLDTSRKGGEVANNAAASTALQNKTGPFAVSKVGKKIYFS